MADLDALSARDGAEMVTDNLQVRWEEELARGAWSPATGDAAAPTAGSATRGQKRSSPSLWRAIYRSETNTGPFYKAAGFTFLESVSCISQPVILGYLAAWLTKPGVSAGTASDDVIYEGWALAAGLVLVSLSQAVVHHALYYYTMRGGWNVRTALTGLVHRKLMRVSCTGLQQVGAGAARRAPLASSLASPRAARRAPRAQACAHAFTHSCRLSPLSPQQACLPPHDPRDPLRRAAASWSTWSPTTLPASTRP